MAVNGIMHGYASECEQTTLKVKNNFHRNYIKILHAKWKISLHISFQVPTLIKPTLHYLFIFVNMQKEKINISIS